MDLDVCFFPQGREIFIHYFFEKLSASFASSFPSGTSVIYILICMMVIHKSLKLSLFFFFFFPTWLDEFHWPVFKFTNPFFWLLGLLPKLSVEFFQLYSSALSFLFCTFKIFPMLKFSLCSCIVFLNFLTVIPNSSQANHLSLFNCNLFLNIYLVLLFATHFPVSSFSLTLSTGFWTLNSYLSQSWQNGGV